MVIAVQTNYITILFLKGFTGALNRDLQLVDFWPIL